MTDRSWWIRCFWEASAAVRKSSHGISPRVARQDIADLAHIALFGPADIGARAVEGVAKAAHAPNVGARRAALSELAHLESRSEYCAKAAEKALAEAIRKLPAPFVAETLSDAHRRRPHDRRRRRIVAVVHRASASGDDGLISRGVGELYELAQWTVSPVRSKTVDDLIGMLDSPNDVTSEKAAGALHSGANLMFEASLAQRAHDALWRAGWDFSPPDDCA